MRIELVQGDLSETRGGGTTSKVDGGMIVVPERQGEDKRKQKRKHKCESGGCGRITGFLGILTPYYNRTPHSSLPLLSPRLQIFFKSNPMHNQG